MMASSEHIQKQLNHILSHYLTLLFTLSMQTQIHQQSHTVLESVAGDLMKIIPQENNHVFNQT